MNVLNRVLVLILLAALLVAALLTAGLATGLLGVARVRQVWPYQPVDAIAHDLATLGPTHTVPVVAGAVILGMGTLLLLLRELAPSPRRERMLLLPKEGQGRTEVAYTCLDDLAAHSARTVQGIEAVTARVDPERAALRVRLRAAVSPYAELATAGPAVEQTVKEHLERWTGVPVLEVRVRAVVQDERMRRHVH